jgi:DNA-binding Lrp family transcriptional regulator
VSRGPGRLQRKILHELSQEPTGYLPWRWLRERYPYEVRDKTFYRAVRSLRRTGCILDYEVDLSPGLGGRARYIAIVPIYEAGGRLHFAYEADRELAALAEAAQR